jgi:hypothetical protein
VFPVFKNMSSVSALSVNTLVYEISGPHGGEYEDANSLLGYGAI